MNIPPPLPIKSPDAEKALAGLKQALPDGGTAFEPTSAIIDGAAAGNAILGVIKVVGFWLARGVILPAELLLRHQIGERYLNPIVGVASVCVVVLLKFVRLIDGIDQAILLAVIGFGLIFRFKQLSRAQRKGIHWHSYSEGDSEMGDDSLDQKWRNHFGPFSTVHISKMFAEPLLFLILYAFAKIIDFVFSKLLMDSLNAAGGPRPKPWKWEILGPHANYFLLAALVMFIYQVYCWSIRRGKLLDALDAQVMAEAYKESMQAEPKQSLRSCRGVAYIPAIEPPTWGSSART